MQMESGVKGNTIISSREFYCIAAGECSGYAVLC